MAFLISICLAYPIFIFRLFEPCHKGKTEILHLCFGTEKNRRLGNKKNDIIGVFAENIFFTLCTWTPVYFHYCGKVFELSNNKKSILKSVLFSQKTDTAISLLTFAFCLTIDSKKLISITPPATKIIAYSLFARRNEYTIFALLFLAFVYVSVNRFINSQISLLSRMARKRSTV